MRSIFLLLLWVLGSGAALAQSPLSGQEKKLLTMTRGNWAYFRDYNGRQLIYFTHLEAYRCGISQVRYSLNSDALDKEWKLRPCDASKPHNITTNKPYISLPLGTAKTIAAQVTFSDGSKSGIVRIGVNNKLVN